MKAMKKLLALVMALALCLSLGVCAMADTVDETDDIRTTMNITKTYKLVTDDATNASSPAEDFELSIANLAVTDAASTVTVDEMPTPTIGQASYTTGAATETGTAANFNVSLLNSSNELIYTSTGVYYYLVTETAGSTAGVTYNNSVYILKVTVTNNDNYDGYNTYMALYAATVADSTTSGAMAYTSGETTTYYTLGSKVYSIDNTYTASDLKVTKVITGAMGDLSAKFGVVITLTAPQGTSWTGSVTYQVGSATTTSAVDISDGSATIAVSLGNNETVTIYNLPDGVTYSVSETKANEDDYKTTYAITDEASGDYAASTAYTTAITGTVDSTTDTVTITNNKDSNVTTGVSLDSLPYVLVLAAVLALGAVLIVRKRRVED